MSRSRLEKDPDTVCGFTWGGTPSITSTDAGYQCPHFCHELVASHGPEHVCCNHRFPV